VCFGVWQIRVCWRRSATSRLFPAQLDHSRPVRSWKNAVAKFDRYLDEIYPSVRRSAYNDRLFSLTRDRWAGLVKRRGQHSSASGTRACTCWKKNGEYLAPSVNLPDHPAWWITLLALIPGKNWRFAKREMGDWRLDPLWPSVFCCRSCGGIRALALRDRRAEAPASETGWYRHRPRDEAAA